jgi:hypothetical protein
MSHKSREVGQNGTPDQIRAFSPTDFPTSPDSGLTLGLLPEGGVQAVLNLPLPDIQGATFGIANLKLGALLALRIHDQLLDSTTSPFSIALGFSLGRCETPFTLTIFVLGGRGSDRRPGPLRAEQSAASLRRVYYSCCKYVSFRSTGPDTRRRICIL